MHEPTSATTGTPPASSGAAGSSGSPPIRAATPIRSPRKGKSSTAPSTSHSNGGPRSGLTESQIPSTPPRLSRWIVSPGASRSRQVAGVAEQGLAVAEGAGDDVAALDLGHAAGGQLELVVGALVGEHAHRDHHPLLAGDLGAHPHLALELAGAGHRGDLVEHDGLHRGLRFRISWPRRPRPGVEHRRAAPRGARSRGRRRRSTRRPPRRRRRARRASSENGERTPSTKTCPGRKRRWTSPVTRSCDERAAPRCRGRPGRDAAPRGPGRRRPRRPSP